MKIRSGPSGIHLFDRTSGLNILIDEVIPREELWALAPRQVSIALTNACDLRCAYCFASKSPAVLELSHVRKWLVELDRNGTVGVGFGGGEPTLVPYFAELCEYATRETNLAVTFTTHGHHLGDKLLSTLRGNVHFVRVSMDGIGSTYERLRRRSFSELQERLTALKEIVPFGINYVVNSETVCELDAAIGLAFTAGASEFLLLPEQPANGRLGVDAASRRSLRQFVTSYSGDLRLAVSELGSDGLPTCNPFEKERSVRAYAHITANGMIKHTSYDDEGVVIGLDGVIAALRKLNHLSIATTS
ncbi:MAG TPA: radical SAM protein [Pyrinomonadaceae bacterium]|nr:radical SAM protein [Pyrinomonadaceae bacterium]